MLKCAWPAQHKGVLYSVGNGFYWKFSGLKNFWCTQENQHFSHCRYIGRWTISTEISSKLTQSKYRVWLVYGTIFTPWALNVMNTGIVSDTSGWYACCFGCIYFPYGSSTVIYLWCNNACLCVAFLSLRLNTQPATNECLILNVLIGKTTVVRSLV